MDWLYRLSLISGPLPWVLTGLGALGGVWLLFAPTRSRGYRRRAIPLCCTAALVLTLVGWLVVEKWWRPFPDPVETEIYVWIGLGVLALMLLVVRVFADRGFWRTVISLLAALAVVAAAAVQVNLVFDAYPTVRDALGVANPNEIDFAAVPPAESHPLSGKPVDTVWRPPPDLPATGRVTAVPIPGTVSGFTARDAQIYLPPAYFANPRPQLPVLVLLAGQPGGPEDWINGGKLAQTMDAFAAEHGGLAPVVVVADGTGSQLANPLCVDSKLGNVATYLATDVPAWVTANLQVDPDPRAWAIGGLSYGGTCSLQMATNHPDRYPTFLDLSGQEEPTLGDHQRTLDAAFGGDEEKFRAVNPMDLMARQQFPNTAGAFVVGRDDKDFKPGVHTLYEAAQRAGMDVRLVELPGGHSFAVWSGGLEQELGWLAKRMGLIS
ncbi:esterase [Rhodococcus spelaei]|uniref:Esterase n=1 Tax=Rhodococcus spelaei TaxID=2546320 RepID=A0A541B7F1_9NOCA|nr:alpha/beta hydrolase-fold protein [Rhodococcus spelaei]TQF68245.1 esterase [Rhodococcus spelaei]